MNRRRVSCIGESAGRNGFSEAGQGAAANCARWNGARAGKEAFTCINGNGYKIGKIFGGTFQAHRVIWAIQTGEYPEHVVDHIDGDGKNNKWANFRAATKAENCRNRQHYNRNNKSGFKGVHYRKSSGQWIAQIGIDGVRHALGYFTSAEDAAQAYDAASRMMHGEFSSPSNLSSNGLEK